MPIQFRCPHCRQMLSISSRKLGTTVNCPACTEPIQVPGETAATKQLDSTPGRPAPAPRPTPPPPAATTPTAATPPPRATPPVPAPPPVVSAPRPIAPVKPPVPAQPPVVANPSVSVPAPVAAQPRGPVPSPPPALRENLWAETVEDDDAPRGVRESRLSSDGLDMTPMVDVTFQLLIFFMITASFVTQKSLQTTPPEPNDDTGAVAVQLEDMQDQSVIVNIDAEGAMLVDDVPIEGASVLVETLMAKMATEQKTQLLIEADYNAKHGAIIQVIDAGLSAGMANIRKTSRQDE